MASSSRLGPREKGKISVKVDIKGKTGNIQKTIQVHTNDPAAPVTNLVVIMQVKDKNHLNSHSAKEIFSGRCSGCHVEKGNNKLSAELYRADCSMCHGAGKSASPLSKMSKKPKDYLTNAIRNGVEGSSMPGWDSKSKGPLGDDEINSLVDLIINYKKYRVP